MYKLICSRKEIFPGWLPLIKKQDNIDNQIIPGGDSNDNSPPKRKRDEFGKPLRYVATAYCTTCLGSWDITMPEAVRFALVGSFNLPSELGHCHVYRYRIHTNFCDNCQKPKQVSKVEIVRYLENKNI